MLRKWLLPVAGLALLLVGLVAVPVRAVEFRSGEVVVIEADEVIDDDLFVSANRVLVSGTVNGDLWAAGSLVEMNGTVNGSLFAAGQEMRLAGDVKGSAYMAGGSVIVQPEANVLRNLYFAGYGLDMRPGSAVERDMVAAGSQALVAGRVARNVAFTGNALVIAGTVGSDVRAAVSEPGTPMPRPPFAGHRIQLIPAGLQVTESAQIGGRLIYESPVEQAASIRSQPRGGVVFRPSGQARRAERALTPLRWLLAWLRLWGTLLALGALALFGLGAPLDALAERQMVVPLLSVGWGILIILAGFSAAVVAALLIVAVSALLAGLTFGGLAAAVFFGAGTAWAFGLTVFLLAVIFGSRIAVSYLLGVLALRRLAGRPRTLPLYVLVVGSGIYALAESIPFFGGLAGAVATVLGFGAIYLLWQDSQAARPEA